MTGCAAPRHGGQGGPDSAGTPGVPEPAQSPHEYLSTSCLHGRHRYCQSTTGSNGITDWAKTPGACKFCDAPCICPCHTGTPA